MQTINLIALAQLYKNKIISQTNRAAVLASRLRVEPAMGGKAYAWVAKNTGMYVESYSEGADAVSFGSDAQYTALLPYSHYRANFGVSGFALAAARNSTSPTDNNDLWLKNMLDASEALASRINADLYKLTPASTDLVSLVPSIGQDANTYAGLDRTNLNYAFWKPYVVGDNSSPAPITLNDIRKDIREIFKKSGSRPDIAVCDPDTFANLANLFDQNKRYLIQPGFVTEGGVGEIVFDGCRFIEDKDCLQNTIFYLNTRYVYFVAIPLMDSSISPAAQRELADDRGFGPLPFGAQVELLGKSGDSDKAQMKTYLQLVVERPNACGARYGVAAPVAPEMNINVTCNCPEEAGGSEG